MTGPKPLMPAHWKEYELIDSGDFEKLERFGAWHTVRPEPQAIWRKSLPSEQWESLASAVFRRDLRNEEKGEWLLKPRMPEQWWIRYGYRSLDMRMRLGLTSFKHVGIFPEQAANWDYIFDQVQRLSSLDATPPRVLNLFAYTGGATLAAAGAGAAVTHVDSVRQVVTWANENAAASGIGDGVRWIVDDALKFVRREVRRGSVYEGIILDPPAYGRGPEGEKWVLEKNLAELLELCSKLLAPHNSFFVLNLYSMGFSAILARTAVNQFFGIPCRQDASVSAVGLPFEEQYGELYFDDRASKSLPLGIYYRMLR